MVRRLPGDPSESVPDIFDEVEEDVRAERVQQFFARYGWAVLALAVVIVLAVGFWRYREWRLERQDQAAASQYLIATTEANAPGESGAKARNAAIARLDQLAASGPEGYRTLARLRAAALLAQQGNVAEALRFYNEIASDSAADPLFRDLATLLWAQRQIDSGDPQILQARLEPLAVAGNPWRPLAERALALLDLRQNRADAARSILRGLAADATAPQGVRESAALMLDRLGS